MNNDEDNDHDNNFKEYELPLGDLIFYLRKNCANFDDYNNSYVLFTYAFNYKSVGDEFQCLVPHPSHSHHRHHQGHLHLQQGLLHPHQGRHHPQQGRPLPHPEHIR
jgi:hypothetical protein